MVEVKEKSIRPVSQGEDLGKKGNLGEFSDGEQKPVVVEGETPPRDSEPAKRADILAEKLADEVKVPEPGKYEKQVDPVIYGEGSNTIGDIGKSDPSALEKEGQRIGAVIKAMKSYKADAAEKGDIAEDLIKNKAA